MALFVREAHVHMVDKRLQQIQLLILCRQWTISRHVLADIENGEFDEKDIETSIMSGWIDHSQKDEMQAAVDGRKYIIIGKSYSGLPFETVGKIVEGIQGEEYFVITAFKRK